MTRDPLNSRTAWAVRAVFVVVVLVIGVIVRGPLVGAVIAGGAAVGMVATRALVSTLKQRHVR